MFVFPTMKTIAVCGRKGGAGKTTLAIHLSVVAAEGGRPVLLFDVDAQRSLEFWWKIREAETPALVTCAARDLARVVAEARREKVAFSIIDTPPHAENTIVDAMRIADVVVVPTRPGPLDLAAVGATLELAASMGKRTIAVINAAPPPITGTPAIVTDAKAILEGMGATVAETVLSQRVAYSHALVGGQTVSEHEPDGRAANEIAALWAELQQHMGD